jgi:anti-anti-sigma factor
MADTRALTEASHVEMSINPVEDRLVKVTFSGRLDAAAVDRVETRFVASVVPNGNSAIIDLSELEYIATLGVRMLVTVARSLRMKQAKMALYGVDEPVKWLFDTIALQQLVEICATEAEALAMVRATT